MIDIFRRDVQHIIVRTARPANLKAPDWRTNGLGRKVSHSYGYGLMDTTAMVRLAKNWTLMPPQVRRSVPFCKLLKSIFNENTVKPVYSDHSRDRKKWSLFRGGRCSEVAVVQRWPLFRGSKKI
jgi:hypothetical protein